MQVPDEIIEYLRSYDLSNVHTMAALRSAISYLGLFDGEADVMEEQANKRKAVRIQAQISTIVTAFSRIRQGKDPVEPKSDWGYAANFLYMLKGQDAEAIEIEAMDKALVLHADHELNDATFTGRVCVATLSDVYSGVTAAIGALK